MLKPLVSAVRCITSRRGVGTSISSLNSSSSSSPIFIGRLNRGIQNSASRATLLGGRFFSSDSITVHFKDSFGDVISVKGNVGESLLTIAHSNDIELEGACGGELACSTCHLILSQDWYDKVIDEGQNLDEEEEDMLDLAVGLTDTSRLGCQICLTNAMEGLEVTIPDDEV